MHIELIDRVAGEDWGGDTEIWHYLVLHNGRTHKVSIYGMGPEFRAIVDGVLLMSDWLPTPDKALALAQEHIRTQLP